MSSDGISQFDLPEDVQVAPTAQQSALKELEIRLAKLEDRLASDELSEESKIRGLLINEIEQRILFRRFAVWTAIIIISFMVLLLVHGVHKYYWFKMVIIPQSIILAMFVTPIISITTLSVLLIIGAFRRFNDDDMSKVNVTSLASEIARTSM